MIRILGVDPGLRHTGWGVIESDGQRLRPVACGSLDPDPEMATALRLAAVHEGLLRVIRQYQPEETAIEAIFVNRNPAASLKLGLARGAAITALAVSSLPVFEYAALTVKKTVTGRGKAEKTQVQGMIRLLLPGLAMEEAARSAARSSDAADALAVAICHAYSRDGYRQEAQSDLRRRKGMG